MKYKINKSWFTKDNTNGFIDVVDIDGKRVQIGHQKIIVRRTEKLFARFPEDQSILEKLYNMGKEYIIKVDDKVD